MGIRLYLGTGYGILLPPDEVASIDPDRVLESIRARFAPRVDAWARGVATGNAGNVDMATSAWYVPVMKKHELSVDKLDTTIPAIINSICESVAIPGMHRTLSFFGFVNDVHFNSDTCHAMLHPLMVLGVRCTVGHAFEYHVPVVDINTPLSTDQTTHPIFKKFMTGNDMPRHSPSPDFLLSGLHKEYKQLVGDAVQNGTPVPFQTKEECDAFTIDWIKRQGTTSSMRYHQGLDIVRSLHPGKEMRDIERYIVGWWS